MKHVKLFEDFKQESANKWYDKPSKISLEIFDIIKNSLSDKFLDAVKYIEPNRYDTLISPPTVSNKGQSRGVNEYKTIDFTFKEPYGHFKIKGMTVGLKKGTSGRDTGYIAVKLNLPNEYVEKAIEFQWGAKDSFQKLYDNELEKYLMDESTYKRKKYGL